jgi:calcineurin-like phosphoesterase family protein
MDETLIKNWNEVVKRGDNIYHLGDFSFTGINRTLEIISELNGNIHLIRGNHDKKIANQLYSRFVWIKDYYDLRVRDPDANRGAQHIVLMHYAMRVWDKSHHGAFHLYGHSHGTLPGTGKSFDCGVDAQNYKPISYTEVKEQMKLREFISVDHHN